MERKILLKCLVGSHNYNLATDESDKDYKVFVAPTFDDLYSGNMFSNSVLGEKEDLDYHDIRKLPELFWKSNINFVEVLFSNEIDFKKVGFYPTKVTAFHLEKLFEMRDQIAQMNLPYLFDACKGMYFNKMKYLNKGTEGTQHLVEKYGYDTKQAMHSYRVLDFIQRFCANGYTDFKQAITYNDKERQYMLAIKHGAFKRDEFVEMIEHKFKDFMELETAYKTCDPNEELKAKINKLIKEIVRENL